MAMMSLLGIEASSDLRAGVAEPCDFLLAAIAGLGRRKASQNSRPRVANMILWFAGLIRDDELLHPPRTAAPVRRRDDRVVRGPACGRGALLDRVSDCGRRSRGNRRRQSRLLADRSPRRSGALQALALAEPVQRPRPSTRRVPDGASRREDGLFRPVRLDS